MFSDGDFILTNFALKSINGEEINCKWIRSHKVVKG
jgi:hypothetical protein